MISMLSDIFTDCNNWVRGWSDTLFAIVMVIFVGLLGMFVVNFIKGMTGSKFQFKFFSFFFAAALVGLIIYVCVIR